MTDVVEIGRSLGIDTAEAIVANLGMEEPLPRIQLHFSHFPHLFPGAGSRLANSLRRYRGVLNVSFDVPSVSESQLDELFQTRPWFDAFTRTALGDAIALYAGAIWFNGIDIRASARP